MISESVGGLTFVQVCPRSFVLTSAPWLPPEYATSADVAVSVEKAPAVREPTELHVEPWSVETSALPVSPAAMTRVEVTNATVSAASVEGVTAVAVTPPSTVRYSGPAWLGLSRVVIRQCNSSPQEMPVRSRNGTPFRSDVCQVRPPSVLFDTVFDWPTAYIVSGPALTSRFRVLEAVGICVQETPPSFVRWMFPAPAVKHVCGPVQSRSFALAGSVVRREKLRPPSAVARNLPPDRRT